MLSDLWEALWGKLLGRKLEVPHFCRYPGLKLPWLHGCSQLFALRPYLKLCLDFIFNSRVFQDLQELPVLLAKWVTPEKG